MDLVTFIAKAECECLNESDEHNFLQCLTAENGYLESDCDEQLILSIAFRQTVKVHSLKIKAPKDKGPKSIKLYINQPRTIDFDMADSNTSIQDRSASITTPGNAGNHTRRWMNPWWQCNPISRVNLCKQNLFLYETLPNWTISFTYNMLKRQSSILRIKQNIYENVDRIKLCSI